MRTIRYEYMRPQEIRDAQKEKSIIYLPIGPLEWHSPAMPFGTDPLAAEASARRAAERTGGVVLPTVYAGTERERKPQLLKGMPPRQKLPCRCFSVRKTLIYHSFRQSLKN